MAEAPRLPPESEVEAAVGARAGVAGVGAGDRGASHPSAVGLGSHRVAGVPGPKAGCCVVDGAAAGAKDVGAVSVSLQVTAHKQNGHCMAAHQYQEGTPDVWDGGRRDRTVQASRLRMVLFASALVAAPWALEPDHMVAVAVAAESALAHARSPTKNAGAPRAYCQT